jgi:prolipoprotein diacylglyceryltransferase
MSSHHIPSDQGVGVLSILLTFLVSIWASVKMEVTHGFITFFFAVGTCIAVFFLNRYLKKKFP